MPAHFWFGDRSKPTYTIYMHKERSPEEIKRFRLPKNSKKLEATTKRKRPSKWSWDTDWSHPRKVDEETFKRARKGKAGVSSKYFDLENTPLQQVDELICEFMGDPPPDPHLDSRYYNAMHEFGFWTLYNLGGSYVEERHVESMKKNHPKGCWFRGDKSHDFCGPLRVIEGAPGLSDRIVSEVEAARREALLEWVFLKKWRFGASG